MTKNRLLIFILLALFSSAILFGCGKKEPADRASSGASTEVSGKPVEIKVAFWGSPEEIQIIKQCLAGWEKDNPSISVRLEHTPYSGYASKILTRIAGGAAPDIIATEVDFFVTFAAKDVLTDLNPFIAGDSHFSRNEFFPEVLDRFTVDGRLLAVPRDTAPFACVFYNKDIFDQAGEPYPTDDWTWTDLLGKARRLTKTGPDGRVERYGFYGWAWQNFIYGNGGALVDDVKNPKHSLINSQAAIDGLQFYADLINKHKVMPTPVALSNLGMGIDEMFAGGRLAMFLSGIWETPSLRNHNFNWDVAMFPKNTSGIRRFGTGGSGYCILKSSKHPKEAWEVIKALTGTYGQSELARLGLAQPARISIAEGDTWAGDKRPPENKRMLNEAVKYVVYEPFHARWREIKAKVITPELDLVLSGRQTAAQAAEKMAPEIDRMLAPPQD